jgi:hypothetical protein
MKTRSTWPAAFIVVFLGCSSEAPAGTEQGGGLSSTSSLDDSITKITPADYASAVDKLFGIAPSAQPIPVSNVSAAGGFAVATPSADDIALANYDSALAIAAIATSADHLQTLLQGAHCTAPVANSGSAGAACAAAFIDEVAPLAFRNGPVDAPTLAGLHGLYTSVAVTQGAGFTGGMAAIIEEVLQSPYFLYRGLRLGLAG